MIKVLWWKVLIRVPRLECKYGEDSTKEAEKQLGDEEVYEEVFNNAAPLLKTINAVIAKIRKLGDLKTDYLDYFIIKDPKFVRF